MEDWVVICRVGDGWWRIRCQDGRWRDVRNAHWGDRSWCVKEYRSSGRALKYGSRGPEGAVDLEAHRVWFDNNGNRYIGLSLHPVNRAGVGQQWECVT
jgi:hypothetical protein